MRTGPRTRSEGLPISIPETGPRRERLDYDGAPLMSPALTMQGGTPWVVSMHKAGLPL